MTGSFTISSRPSFDYYFPQCAKACSFSPYHGGRYYCGYQVSHVIDIQSGIFSWFERPCNGHSIWNPCTPCGRLIIFYRGSVLFKCIDTLSNSIWNSHSLWWAMLQFNLPQWMCTLHMKVFTESIHLKLVPPPIKGHFFQSIWILGITLQVPSLLINVYIYEVEPSNSTIPRPKGLQWMFHGMSFDS